VRIEAQREAEAIFEEKRKRYLNAPSRSQQSSQLTEINQSRDCKQTWNSLQKYVNIFLSCNGHTDIRCTLQRKSTVYTSQWKHVLG